MQSLKRLTGTCIIASNHERCRCLWTAPTRHLSGYCKDLAFNDAYSPGALYPIAESGVIELLAFRYLP